MSEIRRTLANALKSTIYDFDKAPLTKGLANFVDGGIEQDMISPEIYVKTILAKLTHAQRRELERALDPSRLVTEDPFFLLAVGVQKAVHQALLKIYADPEFGGFNNEVLVAIIVKTILSEINAKSIDNLSIWLAKNRKPKI